jgi:serine/threonine protein kinase
MKLSGYDQIELIAKGGMAAVFKARQISLDRTVAIKTLFRALADIPGVRERFERESLIIAGFSHPNIVHIYDRGITSANAPYFIMEYVSGRGLGQLIRSDNLAITRKIRIAIQCARALEYAHGKGVIHSDVKPGNVIVDHHGDVKMFDFGISELMGETGNNSLVAGTLCYMAPERVRDNAPNSTLSDIYSFGVLLYELFANVKPAPGVDLEQAAADTPREFVELIRACMREHPGDRPQTVSEIHGLLVRALSRIPLRKPRKGNGGGAPEPENPEPSSALAVPPEQDGALPDPPPTHARPSPPRVCVPENDYWVRRPREIVRILTQLGREVATLTLHFNSNKDFLVTSILGVVPERNILILDEGPDPRINARLLEVGAGTCRTEHLHIRVRFDCQKLAHARYKGRSAIACPLPDSLFYRERRQFFRVTASYVEPPICCVPVARTSGVEFAVRDISVGGLRLREIDERLDAAALTRRELLGCRLHLPGFAELKVDLQIRSFRQEQRKDGQALQNIGTMFINTSPARSSLIQRYVNKIQIAQIAVTKQ